MDKCKESHKKNYFIWINEDNKNNKILQDSLISILFNTCYDMLYLFDDNEL